jgi:hypothetical protein
MHGHGCEHLNIKYCQFCGIVYCLDCNQEWIKYWNYSTSPYTITWTYGNNTYQTNTTQEHKCP